MTVRKIIPGLSQVRLPGVNAYLLDGGPDGLVLVDSGSPGNAGPILRAVQSLGRHVAELGHILLTHCHPDHAGGAAAIKAVTGARIFMHRSDAVLVEAGRGMRRLLPSPGILDAVLYRILIAPKPTTVTPVVVDHTVADGEEIPLAGGISVIHTPGHTEGHVVFLARRHGILFVGDAAANILGLRPMIAYEHFLQGLRSLEKISRHEFDVACFGHGRPIRGNASAGFRKRWGTSLHRG
jgi:glyoxylase-like metal-dependent hydrolase (beta-lactamase superfamily II)